MLRTTKTNDVVPANRQSIGVALVDVIALHRLNTSQRRFRDETIDDCIAWLKRCTRTPTRIDREFNAAKPLSFLELRIQDIKRRMEIVTGFIFNCSHRAITIEQVRLDIGLGAAEQKCTASFGRIRETPRRIALILRWRRRHRNAKRNAERIVSKFVDISRRPAIAEAR